MTRTQYAKLKHVYHVLGARARGKAIGSKEQRDYEIARREYHLAGKALRAKTEH